MWNNNALVKLEHASVNNQTENSSDDKQDYEKGVHVFNMLNK